MSEKETVAAKMDAIRTIFQEAKEIASKQDDPDQLILHLKELNSEYISVGYESTSMELALKDFATGGLMKNWSLFMEASLNHKAQVFVGLGWAIAQERRVDDTFLASLDPFMQFRIWDGCGYFDGIFRQRQTIKNQVLSDYIPEKEYASYYQGIGRSLWYLSKGDETMIPGMVLLFPPQRHADLWRGIGIACAYVGGCDEATLYRLLASANEYRVQLSIGAALVAQARFQSNCITTDLENTCQLFCRMSATEAIKLTETAEAITDYSFESFLLKMQEMLK